MILVYRHLNLAVLGTHALYCTGMPTCVIYGKKHERMCRNTGALKVVHNKTKSNMWFYFATVMWHS